MTRPPLLRITLAVGALLAGAPAAAQGPPQIADDAVARIAEAWRSRVYLVVADGGACRVDADRAVEDPRLLHWKRRVGCAVYVGHGKLLLTTASVVGWGNEVEVFAEGGAHSLARVIATDPYFDLAVLQIIGDRTEFPDVEPLALAEEPHVGVPCVVLGSAYGRSLSITTGRIGGTVEILPGGMPVRVHRVLAPIYPGDSGGLVVDAQGRFVGLVTGVSGAKRPPVRDEFGVIELDGESREPAGQVGFAVPARECARAWTDLPRFGHVRRGFVGVQVSAESDDDAGVRVLRVEPDSPAARGGLRVGDLITRFGDAFIASGRNLCAIVSSTAPHTTVDVHAIRGNEEVVTLLQVDVARMRPGMHLRTERLRDPLPGVTPGVQPVDVPRR